MQSKLILFITFIVFVIAFLNHSFSTKRYLIQSLVQYESFNQNVFDPSTPLQSASSGSSPDLNNLALLYESRTNYLKVINDLKLNIKIDDLNEGESIDLTIVSEGNKLNDNHKLKFSFSKEGYSLLDENLNVLKSALYQEQTTFNGLRISVNSSYLEEYRPIDVHFRNPESMYNYLKSAINIDLNTARNAFFRNEGLLTISYISDNVELGKDIINYANEIFLNQRIYDETENQEKQSILSSRILSPLNNLSI